MIVPLYYISLSGICSDFTFVSDLDNGIQELYFEFINPCSDVTGQQVWKGSQPNKCHFKSSIQFLNLHLRPGAWSQAAGAMVGCSLLLTRPERISTPSTPWAGWRLRTSAKWSMDTLPQVWKHSIFIQSPFCRCFRWFSWVFARISETEEHIWRCLDRTSSVQASDSVHLDVSWQLKFRAVFYFR